jgi:hypothetical protein
VRKLMFLAVLSATAALLVSVPAAFAASGGGCQLQGTAGFAPGLSSEEKPFSYSFAGALSGCQSSEAGAPAAGSVEAGKTLAEQVRNSVTGATDTVTYQEPGPTGTGGCASSTTAGTALITWADGTHTVIGYATKGALAAVSLSGSVKESITLSAVNGATGDPTTFTIATSRYAGDSSSGLLAFQPPEPAACTTATGATTAAISGSVGLLGS